MRRSRRLIRKQGKEVKLLAKGQLTAKVTIQVNFASDAAKAAIEKSGGKLILPAA
jgi:large subunit ribosomal protein L15